MTAAEFDRTAYKTGTRIRLLAQMVNKNSPQIPVEKGMVAGLAGTVIFANFAGPEDCHQIIVKWDNGSNLSLLPYDDLFEVIPETPEEGKE